MASQRLFANGKQYLRVRDLKTALIQEWIIMPQEYVRTLILSMPSRVNQVLEHRGAFIGY